MLPKQVQSDMTIFNISETADSVVMQATELPGVYWNGQYGMQQRQHGVDTEDEVYIIVPSDVQAGSGRTYIDAHQFNLLAVEDRELYWTIAKGDKIVNRLVDWSKYSTPRELERDLGISNVLTVTAKAPNLFGSAKLQHYVMTGR